jgi:hypothetical protein
LFNVGANWTQRHEYRSVKDDLDAVDAVTREQIASVLSSYPLTNCTTLTIGPLAEVAAPR